MDRLALEGDGVGHLLNGSSKGQVAFVPYTMGGEHVRARPLLVKKQFGRWFPTALLKPSPERIDPSCSIHFRLGGGPRWCGGCNWQHLPIDVQRRSKRQLLIETLERIGSFANPPVEETIASQREWRYRNKAQVPLRKAGNRVVSGFYSPHSHDIVPFGDCLVQPRHVVELVHYLRNRAAELKWQIYDEDRHQGWLRHLLIRTNEKGEALLTLVTTGDAPPTFTEFLRDVKKAFPCVIGIHQNVQPQKTHVILGFRWKKLWGAAQLEETLLGLSIRYSAGSFFQVNTCAAGRLYQKAVEKCFLTRRDFILDLYCGVGAMTLAAAREAGLAIGIEEVPSAIWDARENARRNGVNNVRFIKSRAESFLPRVKAVLGGSVRRGSGVVILDPPRAGCRPQVLNALRSLSPSRIVYVSCNPSTLARDLSQLRSHYRLASVIPVDLFPQTAHIESVSSLERRRP